MMKSIAIHVSVLPGQDRGKVEREMAELANKLGFPVTANFEGTSICRMPMETNAKMPDFFGDLFKSGL
jgi:hypothetical protein